MIRTAHAGLSVAALLAIAPICFFSAVMAAALGHVDFAADDGLDVALAGLVEEISSGKKISVVRDRHGRHLLAGRFVQKLAGFAGPIEQAVIGGERKVKEHWP